MLMRNGSISSVSEGKILIISHRKLRINCFSENMETSVWLMSIREDDTKKTEDLSFICVSKFCTRTSRGDLCSRNGRAGDNVHLSSEGSELSRAKHTNQHTQGLGFTQAQGLSCLWVRAIQVAQQRECSIRMGDWRREPEARERSGRQKNAHRRQSVQGRREMQGRGHRVSGLGN